MQTLLSLLARGIYLLFVVFFGFWMAIPVAMGFDSGMSLGAGLVALLYISFFLPAVVIGFLPLPTLQHPPKPLKFCFGWLIAVPTLTLGAGQIYTAGNLFIEWRHQQYIRNNLSSICIFNKHAEEQIQIQAIMDDKWHKEFAGIWSQPLKPKENRCLTTLSKYIELRTKTLYPIEVSPSVKITLQPHSKYCVEASLVEDPSSSTQKWGVNEIQCANQ